MKNRLRRGKVYTQGHTELPLLNWIVRYICFMTKEQRKIELINWITNIENESLLLRMEELKIDSSKELPNEIISLLESSNNVHKDKFTKHTSVRDIIKSK